MKKNWGIPNRGDAAADAAIREVLAGYCRCVDTFDDETLLELFTRDAEWLRPGKEPLRGRIEIAAFLRARDRGVTSRHIATNMVVDVEGPDQAQAVSYYTVLKSAPESAAEHAFVPAVMGEYHDVFRFDQGRWRIARRDTRHVFRAG
jgi:uncharacterized protein (TIGR02246 family)